MYLQITHQSPSVDGIGLGSARLNMRLYRQGEPKANGKFGNKVLANECSGYVRLDSLTSKHSQRNVSELESLANKLLSASNLTQLVSK